MEQQSVLQPVPQSETPATQELPYAPPQVTFVPLKIEERIQTCYKTYGKCSHDITNA